MKLRKTEGAILCPGCRSLIDADEAECPHCGLKAPGLFGFGHVLADWFGGKRDLVAGVMIACVALYGATLALDWRGIGGGGFLSLLSPSTAALYTFGMTGGDAWAQGHYWTVLTYTVLHGGLLHLAFNMMWLRNLGPTIVRELGPARFVVAYFLTGGAAGLASNLLGGYPTIGASGSIFGLMGVLLVFGRRRGGAWGQALAKQMALWAVLGGAFGFLMPNVNNAAHLGGALAGVVLGFLLPRREGTAEGVGVRILALLLVAVTAVGMLASVALMYPRWLG